MQKNTLFEMLTTLQLQEWKAFKASIGQIFKHEKHLQLLELLEPAFKKKQFEQLDRTKLCITLFNNTAKAENHLRVIIHQLTKLLESFLLTKELEQQPIYKNHLLRNIYIKRGLHKRFERQVKKHYAGLEENKGLDTYYDQYLLASDHCKYLQISHSRKVQETPIENAMQQLDYYYLTHRYQLLIENLSLQALSQQPTRPTELKLLLQLGEQLNPTAENPLLTLYQTTITLFTNAAAKDFQQLQEQLEQFKDQIPKRELEQLYTYLINFYIRTSRYGERQYDKVFELYQAMVDYDLLAIETYLPEGKFKNIVTLGCQFQQFAWTEQFIEEYKNRIEPQKRASVYHFNMGAFFFYQKQFETAQRHLIKVENLDIYYMVDVRSLLIRIFYETDQLFATEQYLRSFRDFIRKNKLLKKDFKQAYLNFINLLSQLLKHKLVYGKKEMVKEKLNQKLNSYEVIHHKTWLVQKIEEL